MGRPAPRRSNAPLFIAIAVVLVALVIAAVVITQGGAKPSPGPVTPSASGELSALVATEVEIARRRLVAGDHEEALRRAERALKFDPNDDAAQKVQKEAREIKDRVDAAVAGVRAAKGGDASASGAALWKLLDVAPDHEAVAELVPALDASFKDRAAEARGLMLAARQAAEKTPGQRLVAFTEGQTLASSAEAALRAGRTAEAARDFMKARFRFQVAARSVR
jgi:tetratricopeptide (TPR) repeat protein